MSEGPPISAPSLSASESKARWVVFVLCSLFLTARLVSISLPHTRLWGINHLTYFPLPLAIVFVLLPLVFIVPFFLEFWAKISEIVSRWIFSVQQNIGTLPFTLACVGFSVVVFWIFRSPVQLLGDGQLLITNASRIVHEHVPIEPRSVVFEGRVPLTMVIYVNLAQFLFSHFEIPIDTAFRMLSVIGGGVFVFLALRFLKVLEADVWIVMVSTSLVFFHAGIQFFFGYIEFYPLYFVSAFLYCFAGILCLRGRVSVAIPFLTLLLTIALHYQGVIFIPSFLYLFIQRRAKGKIRKKFTIGAVLSLCVLSLLAFAVYYVQSGNYARRWSFVPIVSTRAETAYTLFSSDHLFDVANAFLLWSFPLIVILLVILTFFRREVNWNHPPVVFLAISVFYFLLLIFVGNPELGYARDWDFFVSSGVPLIVLVVFTLNELKLSPHFKQYLAISTFGMALFTFLPWIWINSSTTKSVDRFLDNLHLDERLVTKNATTYGLDIVSRFLYDNNQTDLGVRVFAYRLRLRTDVKGFETLGALLAKHKFKDADFDIVQETLDRLSGILYSLKKRGLSLGDDPDSSFTKYHSLFIGFTEFYLQNRRYNEAIVQYEELLGIEASSGNAYLGIAKSLQELGKFSEAIVYYDKTLHDPTVLPDTILYDIGYCFYKTQQWNKAISYWELALQKGYKQSVLRYFLGFAHYYDGNIQGAKENWAEYLKQGPTGSKKSEILEILSLL